jgi:hypothetical protein
MHITLGELMDTKSRAPTQEAYGELQAAYDHFNKELFGGELPPCLITLQRKDRRVMGYYSNGRFGHRREDRKTDEIAMNPMHFLASSDMEALQTLVHEMCHLWQYHFGKPSRTGYHNKEWADKMQSIGLMPSSTGEPGGKTTGQHMGDYPIEGGRFEAAARELVDSGFVISWYDRAAELATVKPQAPAGGEGDGESEGGESENDDAEEAPASQSGKRVKFTCPDCKANAWGKASLKIMCGGCSVPFEPAA